MLTEWLLLIHCEWHSHLEVTTAVPLLGSPLHSGSHMVTGQTVRSTHKIAPASDSTNLRQGSEIYIANKFPGEAKVASGWSALKIKCTTEICGQLYQNAIYIS